MTEIKDLKNIFYSLYPSLCLQAHKYIANQDVCEDIVQECFIKFWEKCEQKEEINNPASYLSTAIRNSCISYLRQEKFEEDIEEPKLQAILSLQATDDDKEANKVDEMAIIEQALSLLPAKCREIFELSKIKNKSYKEIAETLNISIKTVENQMGKALKIMRQFVKDNPQYFSIIILSLYNFLKN